METRADSPAPGRRRRILHVDCDAFFVQVARLEDPEGAGREELLIVGGSPSGRGVVTSASYGVRTFGVRSGMPTGRALRLCPDAVVVGVPREAISRRSKAVRKVLEELSPVVQAASVDEFYLDLTGMDRLLAGEALAETADRIRRAVLEQTEVSVSIGGATQKLVAKLATNFAKPAGVHVVPPGEEAEFMRRFDLAAIPGIGPSLARSLGDKGLVRVEDVLALDQDWLEKWFGPSRGRWLHRIVRGVDPGRVNPREPRKSISSERTFFEDLETDEDLERRLMQLACSVGRTLRKSELRTRTVTVKLRDADFTTRQASRTVAEPIESDAALFRVARELLAELRRRRRRPARLLGVGAANLEPLEEDVRQLGLFGEEHGVESERDRKVARAVDDLNQRFGDGSVVPARVVKPR